ncbi:MAG TPA: 30S ribosomal protein S13 [Candidatus Thermoplasmatota archaeon]|nr:30S ribosomal protein S13 [Candidatus Thermoplasmatota archaeon]
MAKKGNEKPKKEKKETDQQEDDDFQYIVRIANTDIDGGKKLIHGLSSIKGIGRHMSTFIIKKTGLDVNQKMGYLSEKQIDTIGKAIESIQDEAPKWMLNHQKEYETGEDIHIIGPQIDLRLRDEINIMKKIRSYKGIRHERGLTVRGQRTRGNNRKGLTLGVSKARARQ